MPEASASPALRPNHCEWCGGHRRAALLAVASGKGPYVAGREVGRSGQWVRLCLRGALERGCFTSPPVYTPPTPSEMGRRWGASRRRRAALEASMLPEVLACTARLLAGAASARALAAECRAIAGAGKTKGQ